MTRRMWGVIAAALVALAVSMGSGGNDAQTKTTAAGCKGHVMVIDMPRDRYPHIADHAEDAIAGRTATGKHWPRVLRVNREGTEKRRRFAVAKLPSRPDEDRDEYPPAVGRATLDADVRYVDDSENQGAGSRMGHQIAGLSNGACFRLVFDGSGA